MCSNDGSVQSAWRTARDLEDLHLEQYRARDELPLVLQWPRGRADGCVTLPADLETMDPLATAISQLTLRAVFRGGSGMILRISSMPGDLS